MALIRSSKSIFVSGAAIAVLVAVGALRAAETPGLPDADHVLGTDAVKAFIASRVAKGYVAPKTPWGDPDIQGNFTTKNESTTPFQRPDEWKGRKFDDITGKEFTEAVKRWQEEAAENLVFAGGGEPENGVAIAVPIDWFDNMAGRNSRPWFVIDPEDGKVPEKTAEAKSRPAPVRAAGDIKDTDSYLQRTLADRCILYGGPYKTPVIYGDAFAIVQTPNYVVVRAEMIHEARVIPIKGRASIRSTPFPQGTYVGDNRAHWDGNTLVVETTNFGPETVIRNDKATPRTRIIERYTRTAPDKVEWTITVDDPTTYVRPWTWSLPMTQDDKYMIYEYACHEGNYGMANMLSAGRAAAGSPKTPSR